MNLKFLERFSLFKCFFCALSDDQNQPFWNDVQVFKKQDSIAMPAHYKTLFIGSSSFTKWQDVQEYFPSHPITNRAFGGSNLLNLIQYKNDVLNPYHPKQIVIYCGENDIANDKKVTGETVYNRFRKLYKIIKQKYPDVFVAYVSMNPSPSGWHLREKMTDGNSRIESFLKNERKAVFINILDKMLDKKGKLMGENFIKDSLHMNSKGYEIWRKEIAPSLKF